MIPPSAMLVGSPHVLPFRVQGRSFSELSEAERDFFATDEYLPLPETHGSQIVRLERESARAVRAYLRPRMALGPFGVVPETFGSVSRKTVHGLWSSDAGVEEVRQWLHHRGVAYAEPTFLLYDEVIVLTPWKLLLRYWDAFAWSVGVAMLACDAKASFICEFHHEDVITFWTRARRGYRR